ncbi:MAG: IS30 family transposase [Clostridiaceae bacterium]|nr:IS30 family transposase [Clostridiaceae bacterium]
MSKNIKGNHKHLTLSERIYIEQALNDHRTFKSIAFSLGKDPSTISKEVIRSMEEKPILHYKGNDCKFFDSCTSSKLCASCCFEFCKYCNDHDCRWLCSIYEPARCPGINTPPYVCNACVNAHDCGYTKQYYNAASAQQKYEVNLVESRQGICMNPNQLQALNELISPLIRKGQPLSHVFASHADEIGCSRRTLYNYLDQGLFDVRNIDLPRRVRYKIRKKKRLENPVIYSYRTRRTFKDFEKYHSAFPEYEVVELDTVKGTRDAGKCLLTMLFRNSSFMLIFLLPSCSQNAVATIFDELYETLGRALFMKTFHIILTDNGPEFKSPWSIEKGSDGKQRTRVYYCDPYASNQKGRLEKNHEFIRYIIPKGRSMYNLTQDDTFLMARHINSLARDSLNGKCPFDFAELLLNAKVLAYSGQTKVSPDEVLLKPALLKK